MNPLQGKRLSFKQIIEVVSEFYDISKKDIVGPTRIKEVVKARQIVAYLAREKLKKSYPVIGQRLGDRDHTTVLYSYCKIRETLKKNENLKKEILSILNLVEKTQKKIKKREGRTGQLVFPGKRRRTEKPPSIIISLKDLPKQKLSLDQTNRQVDILKKYKDGWTLEEIGKEYKITRERVRQIVEKGLYYNAREIVKQGIALDLNEFLKQEKRKHLSVMRRKHGIFEKQPLPVKKQRRWSKYYDQCRKCGTAIIPHHSYGYCRKCYPKTKIFKEIQEASRLRNIEKRKKMRENIQKNILKDRE